MLGKSVASQFWMLVVGFKSAAHSAGGVDRGSRGARLKPWVLNAVFFLLVVLGAMVQGSTPAIADNCGTIPSGSVLNGFPNPTLTCNAGSGIDASAALNIVNTTNGTGGGTVSFSAGAASGYLLSSNSCSGGGCNTSSGPVFICNSSAAGGCSFRADLVGPGGDRILYRGVIRSGGTTALIGSFITRPAIGDAGPDQTVDSGSIFTLDASASNAPTSETNDSITSYTWFQTTPTFSVVPGSGPVRTITAPVLNPGDPPVTLTYTLSVSDSFLASSGGDLVNITVNAPPLVPEIDISSSESGSVGDGGTDAQGSEPAGVAKTGTYTVNNTGTDTLTLSGTPTTSNPVNVGSLTVSPPASNTIAAGASTTFTVSYTPTIAGAFSFDLDVGSDDADENPYDIAVSGTATGAPEIEISSSETGSVADGGTDSLGNEPLGVAKTLTYTITNTGTADLSTPFPASASNLVNVSTPSTSFFSSTIPPGTSDTFTVTFTPLAAGPFSFDLDLGNNDADENPYDIAVVGNSTGDPEIAVSSSESGAVGDGGTDAQGSEPASVAKTVTYTINNTGTDTLTLSGTPTTSNPVNVGSLTVSPPASNTIAAGASITFTVSYTPTIAGAFSFDLDIGSDDADENPYDIAVSGTATGAPEIEISSSETGPVADGGTDAQGAESAGVAKTVTYTISNTGTDTLTISGTPTASNQINVTGVTISSPGSNTLAPSASTTFTVSYTPTNVGPFSLDVDVASNDGDENPYDILIAGAVSNNPPVADAGPDQTGVASAATVTLDGSASSDSDPGDSIASFAWAQTAGTGVTLSSNSVSGPTFSAPSLNVGDPSVTLTFELTVTDTQGATDTDTVSITVNAPGNNPPVADAGPDQTGVASGATVTLDGSASSDSDPGDSIASFAWAQTAGTGVTLSSTTIAGPTFTAPSLNVGDPSVTLTFELTVTDTQGAMATDTVSITVNAPGNNPPVADAGPDQTGVASGATVTLDGSASSDSDPGDSIASFAWAQTAGTGVTLSSNSVSGPTFTSPSLNVGDPSVTLTFELLVTDTQGAMATDTVSVTVNAPIAPSDPTVIVVGNPDGTITVSGDADPDTTVTVTFPDGSEAMTPALPDGTYTVTSPTPQTSGIVTAVSTDTDGNPSNPVSVDYMDTVAPQDPDVTVSDNDDRFITVIGTAEPGATVTVTFPDGTQGTDMVGPDGTYSVSSQDPQPDGPVTVVITDPAGNSSNPVTVPFSNGDASPPTVEIIGAPQVSSDPFTVTIVFNEDVTGFELADVLVENGTASNFVVIDAQNYNVTIDPSRETDTRISIPANVANDLAGNGNLASAQIDVKSTIVEDTRQVIASFISNRANHILNNQPNMIDFVLGSHLGKGGPLGNLNVRSDDQNLALAFSTSRSKILAARDRASTLVQDRIETSHAGVNGSIDYRSVSGRDNSVLSQYSAETKNEKDLAGLSLQPLEDEQGFAPTRTGTWDVWTEIYGSVSNSDTTSSSLWVGYLGAHYFISENQLVGVVGQLDWAEESDSNRNSQADGVGWMIGPYVAGRIDESDLFYEARVAYGLSSNDVSPIGTFTDGFDTERFLARAKLQGVYDLAEFVFSPSITFSYFEERQSDYTDSFGNLIPEQTISLGELRFGPEIGRTVTLSDGTLFNISLGVSGIYNFAVENNVSTQGFVPGNDDFRARLDATIGFNLTNGSVLRLEGYYDGIGADDYESIGGGVRVTIPFE